ncbi:unnamed protein product [Staurois parvus]|uniref:Protein BCCIP homolog n=1 Tax=Staurois parvus TaxID=386267 RepID=A0ABN9HGH7_9NEOB|nr:unnamed protein product [Staurois parvus]
MSDSDRDGMKKLLKQLFLKAKVNIAELADLLIQQNHIGSVIKQAEGTEDSDDEDEDDHVFGFISLFNLTERKETTCAEQVKELILSQCEKSCDQSTVEQLDKVLNDNSKPVGLLLSERFINVPAQIALPMHQQLQKELADAQRTNKPCGKMLLLSHYQQNFHGTREEIHWRWRISRQAGDDVCKCRRGVLL